MFYSFYFIVFFGLGVLFSFMGVFFKEMTTLTDSQVTMMMSIVPLIGLVSQNLFGYLSDKTKKHKSILMLVMMATVVTALIVRFASNFNSLIILLGSFFLFAFFYSTPGSLYDNFSLEFVKKTKTPYGQIRLFGSLGYAIAAQVAGVITQSYGVSIIFYVYAACMLISILFVPKFPEITDGGNKKRASMSKGIYKTLLTNKTYKWILACAFFIIGALNVNNTFFGLYMLDIGIGKSMIGTMTMVSALTELPMMLFSHKLINRYGAFKMLALSASVNVIRCIVYFINPGPWPMLLVTATHGIGFGLAFTSVMHIINSEVDSDIRGSGITMMNSVSLGLGTASTTFIGSIITGSYGIKSIYLIISVLQAFGIISALLAMKYKNNLKVNEEIIEESISEDIIEKNIPEAITEENISEKTLNK